MMNETQSPIILVGAIAGDIIGSRFEFDPRKSTDFELFSPRCQFTDDTILTIAVADAILSGVDYGQRLMEYGRRYPYASYGGSFRRWLNAGIQQPYNSYGNGSAMRVSPVGWAFEDIIDVLREAERSANPTHNHPEGIKGAQAIALAIFLARQGQDKDYIRSELSSRFGYDLNHSVDEIRPGYQFDETCQVTVPAALIAFLDSVSLEDTIRKAISLGGDADTLAAIAGSVAEAYYHETPVSMIDQVKKYLDPDLWNIVRKFSELYPKNRAS
jgi:ADP-ribosylglycohydrolase